MATGGGEERNCLTILWRIENISCFDQLLHEECICSPFYFSHALDQRTWLGLYPKGECEGDEHLGIKFCSFSEFSFPVDIEFSLLACDGSPLITRTVTDQKLIDTIVMPDCPTHAEVFSTKKSIFLSRDALTVRCRIWKTSGNFSKAEFISGCSRINVTKCCVPWPITNYGKCKEVQDLKEMARFEFSNEFVYFDFRCSLIGGSLLNYELSTCNEIKCTLLLKLKVSNLSDEQEKVILLKDNYMFKKSNSKQIWNVPELLVKEELSKKMPSLSFDKNLNLLFHFTAIEQRIGYYIEKIRFGKYCWESKKPETTQTLLHASCQTDQKICETFENSQSKCFSLDALVEDFQSLYCKQNFTDFKLRSSDVSFPVHKAILCSRSPVFEAMFSNDMKESGTDSLDIPDLDSHTLNRMLTFLYTGNLEPDLELESAAKVYYAADKYQVDTLKQECSSILKSALSVSNVSKVLTLAHKHQDEDLTSFVHDFILSCFDKVMRSEEWENFLETDPYLAGKCAHLLYKRGKITLK